MTEQAMTVTGKSSVVVRDRTFVALAPADIPGQQAQLVQWCDEKIASLRADYDDFTENLAIAKRNKWKHSSFQAHARKTAARMQYYEKVKAAVQAGYLIVPNFNVEVMAVRVSHHDAPANFAGYEGAVRVETPSADLLPVGEGRYVDDKNYVEHKEWQSKDAQGRDVTKHQYSTAGYDEEPDFPVSLIKPLILQATERAMALKIFDRIGVVTGKKQDPVVIGQLIDPRSLNKSWQTPDRMVSFFIAWWLDTRSL